MRGCVPTAHSSTIVYGLPHAPGLLSAASSTAALINISVCARLHARGRTGLASSMLLHRSLRGRWRCLLGTMTGVASLQPSCLHT